MTYKQAQEQIRCNMPSKNTDRHISTTIKLAGAASHCVFLQVHITEVEQISQTYMSNVTQVY